MKMKDLTEMSINSPADPDTGACRLTVTHEQRESLFNDPEFLLLFLRDSSIKNGVIKFLHFELTCVTTKG